MELQELVQLELVLFPSQFLPLFPPSSRTQSLYLEMMLQSSQDAVPTTENREE
jgi:hypothetical protein